MYHSRIAGKAGKEKPSLKVLHHLEIRAGCRESLGSIDGHSDKDICHIFLLMGFFFSFIGLAET